MRYQTAPHPGGIHDCYNIQHQKNLVNNFSGVFFKFFSFFFIAKSKFATTSVKSLAFLPFIIYAEGAKVKYKYEFDQLIIELYGDVDEHYVKKIRDDIDFLISRQGISSVVFDFKNVSFVDSTGLGLIFGRYKKLLARKVELLLRNVPSHVDRVFRTSGVYSVCPKI